MRSRLPDLVHHEIGAWLIVYHAIAALITRAAEAADLDPDRISFTPRRLSDIVGLLNPLRRERTCPRAVKRARHNNYRVKKPSEPANIRHCGPATSDSTLSTPSHMINFRYTALALNATTTLVRITPSTRWWGILTNSVPERENNRCNGSLMCERSDEYWRVQCIGNTLIQARPGE